MKVLEAISPIAQLENQIDILNQEISTNEAELLEFQSGIEILENHPDWKPRENSTVFETLEALITNKATVTEREERLNNVKSAIAHQEKLIAEKKAKVKTLEGLLLSEKEETEWQQKYAPHVAKFEAGFPVPTDPNIQKINSLRKDIAEMQPRLDEATRWMAAPQFNKPRCFYCRNPKQDFQVLPDAIAVREEMIEKLQNEPIPQRDEVAFRAYIVARVHLEAPLSKLMEAQRIYGDAIAEFKSASIGNESAIQFDANALVIPAQVAIEDGKIILG